MIYAEILAGGIGSRMNLDMPKQYIEINNKPIIIYTVEKFVKNDNVDRVLICCKKDYFKFVTKILNQFLNTKEIEKCYLVESGEDRNETVINGCNYIKENFGINIEDRIITIDAVRMFVTDRIINENIEYSKKYDAVGTFFPVVDTVIESFDANVVSSMPKRKFMYQAQAPQTFNIEKLLNYYNTLDHKVKEDLTDVGKIFFLNGEEFHMVKGDFNNFKVTYLNDLNIAKDMLNNNH